MGYMGLGLQRWVYSQKPRKFFSKDRTNPGSSFDIGSDSGAKVAGRAGDPKEARKRVNRYFELSRQARAIGSVVLAAIALLLGWLAYAIYSTPAPEYIHDEHLRARRLEAVQQRNAEERQNAYLLLMESGNEHFRKREFEWAIEEYTKAGRIFPKAEAPTIGIARSYKYLCEYYGQSCAEAEAYKLWVR